MPDSRTCWFDRKAQWDGSGWQIVGEEQHQRLGWGGLRGSKVPVCADAGTPSPSLYSVLSGTSSQWSSMMWLFCCLRTKLYRLWLLASMWLWLNLVADKLAMVDIGVHADVTARPHPPALRTCTQDDDETEWRKTSEGHRWPNGWGQWIN